MIFEISNPSDPYTMEAESFTAALAAVAILGEGRYGLKPIGNDGPHVPPILWGDWSDEVYAAAGVKDSVGLCEWLNASAENNEATAWALDSVCYGGPKDRDTPREIQQRKRSSMNNIGALAWEYAKALRGKRTFAGVDEKNPVVETVDE